MKTFEEVRDTAYLIATSNTLTDCLNYDEFQDINDEALMKLAWEPLENWSSNLLINHIVQIADAIIDAFKPEK